MIIVPVEKKIDWQRPPIVLIILVVINILVFAFYQSGDNDKYYAAAEHYDRSGLIDLEWRAFQAYSRTRELPYQLDREDPDTVYYLISDTGFDKFMDDRGAQYVPLGKRQQWQLARDELQRLSGSISSNAYGFHSNDIGPIQLLSYQFLHGDLMHLVGNLVFLILVGFTVEAALGSGLFLAFYLLSGACGALVFAGFSWGSSGALVGASGSVSGVMAMYLMLYGFKKINFFYWFFVFTGYIRAAAIVLLPVYLLKEIYGMMAVEGSNVAFSAHIGGFLAGALLVFATRQYRDEVIDDEYLENKPEVKDTLASSIEKMYDLIGVCEHQKAWQICKQIKKGNEARADLVEIEYLLIRALFPKKVRDYLIHRMDRAGNPPMIVEHQLSLWSNLSEQQKQKISISQKFSLMSSAIELKSLEKASELFDIVRTEDHDQLKLATQARLLSSAYFKENRQDRAKHFQSIAETLMRQRASNINQLGG